MSFLVDRWEQCQICGGNAHRDRKLCFVLIFVIKFRQSQQVSLTYSTHIYTIALFWIITYQEQPFLQIFCIHDAANSKERFYFLVMM